MLVLAAAIFIWNLLIFRIFQRLKRRHTLKYSEMGKPSWLFLPYKAQRKTLLFLFRREHQQLDDKTLSRMSDSALISLVVSFIALVLGFAMIYF